MALSRSQTPPIPGRLVDQASVPSPIVIDILMDTMTRDRAHMYLFSV